MPDQYDSFREDIRALRRTCYGFGQTSVPGIHTIEATYQFWDYPAATVWFRFVGLATIEILNSLVVEKLRRCGLRTYLNKALFEAYPQVVLILTQRGTPDGEAFMKASGYRQTELGWELRRKKKRSRPVKVAKKRAKRA
jgi:hypothetical protein